MEKRAHYMTPLTNLITKKKGPVKWTLEADEAFHNIKRIYAEDVLLHYPDYTQPFELYTDSSEYQMGGVITQQVRVIAYLSKKLSTAQTKYPTIEQELLAICEILK